ncbi:MAG: hypothetical protein HY820_45465 [Acidobacteria bacterium]|nr:hypothetical protein [Acidobacteriota bacterium]
MNRNDLSSTIDVQFDLGTPKRATVGATREVKPRGGQMPRLTRLMALAIKCLGMVESGEVSDYAELARAGYVTRARMSQIMNLVNLAPDIQEQILFLPAIELGTSPLTETTVRKIACQPLWNRQRTQWQQLRKDAQC